MPRSKRRGTRNKINCRNSIYDLSKFIIWVFRIPGDTNLQKDGILKEATPCSNCCKNLYKLGFRKIAFPDKEGNIIMKDLHYFENDHLSNAQKNTEKYCKFL